MIQKIKNALCKITGHRWRYKDYSGWMNQNGDSYDFKASRNCTRCNQHGYLYKEWEIKNEKSPHDLERNSYSTKQLSY
jgi:hypothetical protein